MNIFKHLFLLKKKSVIDNEANHRLVDHYGEIAKLIREARIQKNITIKDFVVIFQIVDYYNKVKALILKRGTDKKAPSQMVLALLPSVRCGNALVALWLWIPWRCRATRRVLYHKQNFRRARA